MKNDFLNLKNLWCPPANVMIALFVGYFILNVSAYLWPWIAKICLDRLISGQGIHVPPVFVGAIVIVVLLRFYLQIILKSKTYQLAQQAAQKIRQDIYAQLQRLSMNRLKSLEQAGLLSKAFLDVESIRRFLLSEAMEGVMAVVNMAFLTGILFYLNRWLAFTVILGVPFLIWMYIARLPNLRKGFDSIQHHNERLMFRMGEFVQAAGLIRAMGLEKYFQNRFSDLQMETVHSSHKNYRSYLLFLNFIEIFNFVNTVVIFVFGIFLVDRGRLTLGELFAFYMFWTMLSGPILRLGTLQNSYQEAVSASDRIQKFLSITDPAPAVPRGAIVANNIKGSITLKNVSFGYEGQSRVLNNISWHINAGEMVGLVGESAAGKTTLVQLLLRLYDPCEGNILLDGNDLKYLEPASFRQHIGVVMQDDFIFSGTIYQNLVMGDEKHTESQVKSVLKAACANEFVDQMPGGIHAQIGERGLRLSVGQRQRLAIARALLRKPKILILDEATCALDALTENEVQKNIREFCPEATIIIIAHRFSTIMDVDQIVVLDQGGISQQGTHSYLLSQNGLYSRLYYEQFKN